MTFTTHEVAGGREPVSQNPMSTSLYATIDAAISWSDDLKARSGDGDEAGVRRVEDQAMRYIAHSLRNSLLRPLAERPRSISSLAYCRREGREREPPHLRSSMRLRFRSPFAHLRVSLPCLHCGGGRSQCFPFYTYAEDGSNRRENITDWALEQFRARYHDPSISKWDIFHYIYAVLHHPEYRERYAANLRRELPRIPFVSASTPTLSSRRTRSRGTRRLPVPRQRKVGREFSARTSPRRVLGENAFQGRGRRRELGVFRLREWTRERIHSLRSR